MFDPKLKEALSRVQKPGRYTGGEPGSVYKNKDEVDVRFAFCFPDTYEATHNYDEYHFYLDEIEHDPYYNPSLTHDREDFSESGDLRNLKEGKVTVRWRNA